jgi:hypothetical protein
MAINLPNGRKVLKTTIQYTNIFHSKELQNIPKLGFFDMKLNHLATLGPARPQACTFLNINAWIKFRANASSCCPVLVFHFFGLKFCYALENEICVMKTFVFQIF